VNDFAEDRETIAMSRGTDYNRGMKYEVELTPALDERLARLSALNGEPVTEVIRLAVISFIDREVAPASAGREPGPIIESPEISVPFDLPRQGRMRKVVPVKLPPNSRLPDPLPDYE
jgi:hypothetical protein